MGRSFPSSPKRIHAFSGNLSPFSTYNFKNMLPAERAALQSILRKATHPPVLILGGKERIHVSPREAILMLKSDDYVVRGSRNRVRSLKPKRKYAPWQNCHRTTGAATIQPGDEYGRITGWSW